MFDSNTNKYVDLLFKTQRFTMSQMKDATLFLQTVLFWTIEPTYLSYLLLKRLFI